MENKYVKKGTTNTFNYFDPTTLDPTIENECKKWWKYK
jgi:hypothetical protein